MKASSSRFGDYYYLTKPGIIRGNLLTGAGGFFLAASGNLRWGTLAGLLVGMALVIGGSCVLNNIYDHDIDARMPRTKKRALVSGSISTRHALQFGVVLCLLGLAVLLLATNVLTTVIGAIGLVSYVGVYTPAKHRTPYATLLGTIPGATPPVAGYTAISGHLDGAAWLLFFILVAWQMPHFYAIAIRRLAEYKAAKVPVWPLVHDIKQTQTQMVWFMAAFIALVVRFSLSGYASAWFAIVLGGYGSYWLVTALRYRRQNNTAWAKKVFLLSLPVLPLFSLLLILDSVF